MSEKREALEDAEGVVSQGPCDMVKSWIAWTVRHITESRILLTEEGGTEEQTSGSPN
jgi:hypothetical protein